MMAYAGHGMTLELHSGEAQGGQGVKPEIHIRVNYRHPAFLKLTWKVLGDLVPWWAKVLVIVQLATVGPRRPQRGEVRSRRA